MIQRLVARLLHLANADPPWNRATFYGIKDSLLRRHGTFRGHDIQEIRKPCWGDRRYDEYGDEDYLPCDSKCRRCGGTGLFDIRWVRLERWEWCGWVFHRPVDDTRKRPESVQIHGRIEHPRYGRLSNESALWLYLLTGHWREFWKLLTGSWCCGWYLYPMLNLQRVATILRMKLAWRRCHCGRAFPTFGTGWLVCRKCRTSTPTDIPF